MKIEVWYLTSQSPFRAGCWAVIKDGVVQAYCFTAEAASYLEIMLLTHAGDGN